MVKIRSLRLKPTDKNVIVSADVVDNRLVLQRADGSQVNGGRVSSSPEDAGRVLARAESGTYLAPANAADRPIPDLTITFTVRTDDDDNVIPVDVTAHLPWLVGDATTTCIVTLKDEGDVITSYAIAELVVKDGIAYGHATIHETIDEVGQYQRSVYLNHPNGVGSYAPDIAAGVTPFIQAEEKPRPLA